MPQETSLTRLPPLPREDTPILLQRVRLLHLQVHMMAFIPLRTHHLQATVLKATLSLCTAPHPVAIICLLVDLLAIVDTQRCRQHSASFLGLRGTRESFFYQHLSIPI